MASAPRPDASPGLPPPRGAPRSPAPSDPLEAVAATTGHPRPPDALTGQRPVTRPENGILSRADQARLRRRWPIPLACTAVVTVLLYATSFFGGSTYIARATLELFSTDNSPAQESVMAQGYADFFNQPTVQDGLRRRSGVSESVTMTARVAAASPLLYIEATGPDPQAAQAAADQGSRNFRDEIDAQLTNAITQSPATLTATKPASLDTVHVDTAAEKVTTSHVRELEGPVGTTALLSTLAVLFLPDRRRRTPTTETELPDQTWASPGNAGSGVVGR